MLLENNICTLIQLMITVLLDDPIICDLPIKVIKIDEFLSMIGSSGHVHTVDSHFYSFCVQLFPFHTTDNDCISITLEENAGVCSP